MKRCSRTTRLPRSISRAYDSPRRNRDESEHDVIYCDPLATLGRQKPGGRKRGTEGVCGREQQGTQNEMPNAITWDRQPAQPANGCFRDGTHRFATRSLFYPRRAAIVRLCHAIKGKSKGLDKNYCGITRSGHSLANEYCHKNGEVYARFPRPRPQRWLDPCLQEHPWAGDRGRRCLTSSGHRPLIWADKSRIDES